MALHADLRDGLKTRIETIAGIRVYDTFPESPQVPCAIIMPDLPLNERVSIGVFRSSYLITMLLQLGRYTGAQDTLDGHVSTTGSSDLLGAIEADRSLGGKATTLMVREWGDYGSMVLSSAGRDIEYLGAKLRVDIYHD